MKKECCNCKHWEREEDSTNGLCSEIDQFGLQPLGTGEYFFCAFWEEKETTQ